MKKIVYVILVVLLLFVSCEMESEHEHTFSTEWESDENYHWHAATCEHTDEVKDKGAHVWNDGICTVCGRMNFAGGVGSNNNYEQYFYILGGELFVWDKRSLPEVVIIPETIDGASVERIGNYAFLDCTQLEKVTMPNTVTSIGDGAFMGCTQLEKVTMPNAVTSIGNSAFANCSNLKEVAFSNELKLIKLESIEDRAFWNCNNLEKITLNVGLKSIGTQAFYSCDALKEISLPHSLKSIGYGAFDACNNLKTINFHGEYGRWITVETHGAWAPHQFDREGFVIHCWSDDMDNVDDVDCSITTGVWCFDDTYHWTTDDKGSILDKEEHSFIDDMFCPDCLYTKPEYGYVFFDKGYYSDGWRYLMAAPSDLKEQDGVPTVDPNYTKGNGFGFGLWKRSGNAIYVNGTATYNAGDCTGTAIGTGMRNTQLLAKASKEYSSYDSSPASLCDILTYTVNGVTYDDWFLPSKDELTAMYLLYKKGIGGFSGSMYLSSSKYADSVSRAWIVSWLNGHAMSIERMHQSFIVRPIRAF